MKRILVLFLPVMWAGCAAFDFGRAAFIPVGTGVYVVRPGLVESSLKILVAQNPGMVITGVTPSGAQGYIHEYWVTTIVIEGAVLEFFHVRSAEDLAEAISYRHAFLVTALVPIHEQDRFVSTLVIGMYAANVKEVSGVRVLDNAAYFSTRNDALIPVSGH